MKNEVKLYLFLLLFMSPPFTTLWSQDCNVLSDSITLENDLTEIDICAGDGASDAFEVVISDLVQGDIRWVITDTSGLILGLPEGPPFDLEGAGQGICLVWLLTSEGELTGLDIGLNTSEIQGCFDLSNPITVNRTGVNAGEITTTDSTTELSTCAGDGVSDAFDVIISDDVQGDTRWVITDPEGNVLGLPDAPPFDLEGAGQGTCLVWLMAFNGDVLGIEVGNNAADFQGCFDLSNPITVTRTGVNAGEITTTDSTTELSICAGDGVSDAFDVIISDDVQGDTRWVITDPEGNVLGLPDAPPFDLEGAGQGTCLVWLMAFSGDVLGIEVGNNAADFQGCFDLSNPITVTRTGVNAGEINTTDSTTELSICAGDGVSDAFDVIISDDVQGDTRWVITDPEGNVLGLPDAPPFDLEGAGQGTCLVWLMAFNGDVLGIELGNNAADFQGCFDLSNPITVTRTGVNAGEITTTDSTTELSICAGDGVSDAFDVIISDDVQGDTRWVITDPEGNVLGLPDAPPFDLEGAGQGTCLVWLMAFSGDVLGIEVGNNAADFEGCFDLSNPITVNRSGVNAGEITTTDSTTELSICAGDGVSDAFDVIISDDVQGDTRWVITDPEGNVLGLPDAPPFDLEGAGQGTCLVWLMAFSGDVLGIEVGNNAADFEGCFDLSNPITVNRSGVNAGEITTTDSTTELSICAGDGVSDAFDVIISDDVQGDTRWVITDPEGNVLGLPDAPPFDLEGAGQGTCLVWLMAFNGDVLGIEVGNNAADFEGCFDLSNPITVTRTGVNAGEITTTDSTTELSICAGDGVSDAFDVIISDDVQGDTRWVITDPEGNVLGLPDAPPFDLEGAGQGTCLVWLMAFSGDVLGIEVGNNAADFQGCFDLSNPITVNRTGVNAGEITTTDSTTELSTCAGDGVSDAFDVIISDDVQGDTRWVITDPEGNVLGLPDAPPFDLEGAGRGTCLVWLMAFNGDVLGIEVGNNATDFQGCFDLSNPITVTRNIAEASTIETTDGLTEISICAGDGKSDAFNVEIPEDVKGDNIRWIITDPDGNILGLPDAPPFDLESAGQGTCLVWLMAFNGDIQGVSVGLNASEITGCYDLSNPITVTRTGVNAGVISTTNGSTEITICAGDGMSDAFDVQVSENILGDTRWIITDPDGNVLGLPDAPPFDLEGAGQGTCLVWHMAFNGEVQGIELGNNAADFQGCYSLSNPITVNRISGADCNTDGSLALEHGEIIATGEWQSIQLTNFYYSPVIVATAEQTGLENEPVVTRLRNVNSNGFELKVQNPGGTTDANYIVRYVVVEEGVYTKAEHGIKMEAVKVHSRYTAHSRKYIMESRSYSQDYRYPIVLGQVMTFEDEDWSVFWSSRMGTSILGPSSGSFAAGKHVGEDTDITRNEETLGIIIIESGVYEWSGELLQAGTVDRAILGVQSRPDGTKVNSGLDGISNGVLSLAGVRSRDGGWPVFAGPSPFNEEEISLSIDEDQIKDQERRNIGSLVNYLIFGERLKRSKRKKSYHPVSKLNSSDVEYKVFPNPASQFATIEFNLIESNRYDLQLIDAIGRTLFTKTRAYTSGWNKELIHTQNIANGIYQILILSDENVVLRQKLVVQH